MLQVVARLADGKPFRQPASSIADALTILQATIALVGNHGHVWIESYGEWLDVDRLRRDHALLNSPSRPPRRNRTEHKSAGRLSGVHRRA